MSETLQDIRARAIALLARREHSAQELQQKLNVRGFTGEAVAKALLDLQRDGLQSNQRYTEAYIRTRTDRGYGPLRISRELQQKGIAEDMITVALADSEIDWIEHITAVHKKKFGTAIPADYPTEMRQSGFLQYRGFSGDQIRQLFRQLKDDGQ